MSTTLDCLCCCCCFRFFHDSQFAVDVDLSTFDFTSLLAPLLAEEGRLGAQWVAPIETGASTSADEASVFSVFVMIYALSTAGLAGFARRRAIVAPAAGFAVRLCVGILDAAGVNTFWGWTTATPLLG